MTETPEAHSLGKRGTILLVVLAAIGTVILALTAGPVPKADAAWQSPFCYHVTLNPYGQNGDRCTMSEAYANHYSWLQVNNHNRAGCVAATGYYGEQVMGWTCAPWNSQAKIYPPNPEGWYRGTIRNNNTSFNGEFDGSGYCPATCP